MGNPSRSQEPLERVNSSENAPMSPGVTKGGGSAETPFVGTQWGVLPVLPLAEISPRNRRPLCSPSNSAALNEPVQAGTHGTDSPSPVRFGCWRVRRRAMRGSLLVEDLDDAPLLWEGLEWGTEATLGISEMFKLSQVLLATLELYKVPYNHINHILKKEGVTRSSGLIIADGPQKCWPLDVRRMSTQPVRLSLVLRVGPRHPRYDSLKTPRRGRGRSSGRSRDRGRCPLCQRSLRAVLHRSAASMPSARRNKWDESTKSSRQAGLHLPPIGSMCSTQPAPQPTAQ